VRRASGVSSSIQEDVAMVATVLRRLRVVAGLFIVASYFYVTALESCTLLVLNLLQRNANDDDVVITDYWQY